MSVKFHIPDFSFFFHVNKILLKMMEEYPQFFRENIEIASIYGEFPTSLWNGGRVNGGYCDRATMKQIIRSFNQDGIPLRFTFTNPLITKEHLHDEHCNLSLRLADNGFNEVIVVSPLLEEYIRKNYPNYKITSSTCKQLEDFDALCEELEKDYSLVVLDYNWNNRFEELEKIPHKEKCEILVNAVCPPHCQRRKEHYRYLGEFQIAYCKHYQTNHPDAQFFFKKFDCPHTDKHLHQIRNYPTHVSPDDIFEKYVPMGFENFKIEGRSTNIFNLVETYVYYFCKPEYRDECRLVYLYSLLNNHIINVS